ncbi:hypothetical protein L6164_029282 [Bauhinia variegata]|uniref:Uncharacterized protein n=1 Tax=Bauhinia variegata TaxID=167791 RepID=A0ACB9L8L3_BAUVA|nr:hypothetical protein L6164_029282 [Bauhinia variegata]
MICSLFKPGIGFLLRFVLRFLHRSVAGAMGCFFGCFRTREDHRLPTTQLVSDSSRAKSREAVTSRHRLSALFLSEKEGSPCKDREHLDLGSHGEDKELKDQAKFLKACGTLAGTPAEIRKASGKLKVSPPCGKDSDPSRFHSWLPKASIELQQDVQPLEPSTPTKVCEDRGNVMDSLEHTPSSCISNAHNVQGDSVDSTEGSGTGIPQSAVWTCAKIENVAVSDTPMPLTDKRNKSVRFECDTDLSSIGISSEYGVRHRNKTGLQSDHSACKSYPHPTPMKLSDEMQTPGTVYPTTLEDLPYGRPRVRSQFVYSDYNPNENASQFKIVREEDFNSEQDSGEIRDSLDQAQDATPTPEKGLKKTLDGNEYKVDGSLSSWLKPAAVIQEERKRRMETSTYIRKTPGDRPIIGMVAAHWNEDEESRIPPKWWDGNGIPNSTNKYKEDQKVNWHATPFEERLEKALSEETSVPERKPVCGNPIAFDEKEESDTALSNLQSLPHPRSVMSC